MGFGGEANIYRFWYVHLDAEHNSVVNKGDGTAVIRREKVDEVTLSICKVRLQRILKPDKCATSSIIDLVLIELLRQRGKG